MTESSYHNGNGPRVPEEVTRRAVLDVLRLRNELMTCNFTEAECAAMLAASLPAYIRAEQEAHVYEEYARRYWGSQLGGVTLQCSTSTGEEPLPPITLSPGSRPDGE